MRRVLFVIAAATAILSVISFAPNRAEAMTLPAPAALAETVAGLAQAETVAYVCRRWCGPYGCSRRCWWSGPRYYRPHYRPYYRPYRYYRY